MMTPAQRARMRALARVEADASSGAPKPAGGTALDKMLARLRDHKAALRALQSMQARADLKREMIGDYTAYVDGVLEADSGRQDPVVVTMMIWSLDIGDHARALTLARYILRHDLRMPEGFERGAACWLLEELARAAEADPSALAPLADALALTAGHDMPDPARAKAHRVLGLAAESADPAGALGHLRAALRLHPGCGVKQAIARLEKQSAVSDAPTS